MKDRNRDSHRRRTIEQRVRLIEVTTCGQNGRWSIEDFPEKVSDTGTDVLAKVKL